MLNLHRLAIKERFDQRELLFDEPMSDHTSFKIGGPADLLFVPKTLSHLEQMIQYCQQEGIEFYIIGNGSNLLVSDLGYRGVIIQVYKNLSAYRIEGHKVYAEAGILLAKLARHVYDAGLEGFEFASGIPGTLGGAVYMNAGAYGGEMKDCLICADVLSRTGDFRQLTNEALQLGYRHSILMEDGDIVVSVELAFKPGHQPNIKSLMDDLNQRRRDKQPVDKPSAGSTFKRPEGYYAGKLIMDAGLRGHQIGGARVSDKHCGFIINTGQATCEDVTQLIDHIQEEVKRQFGVILETEVRMIGDFNRV